MAWLYENSPGWRRFVNYTRQSRRCAGGRKEKRERRFHRKRETEREQSLCHSSVGAPAPDSVALPRSLALSPAFSSPSSPYAFEIIKTKPLKKTHSHTAAFATAATLGSIALGSLAMAASSRDEAGGELETSLRKRALGSVDASVLAAANKSRLAVLLEEARQASEEKKTGKGKNKKKKGGGSDDDNDDDGSSSSLSSSSEARYRAALRGESLGTHSGGTTTGATAILRSSSSSSSDAGRKETRKK